DVGMGAAGGGLDLAPKAPDVLVRVGTAHQSGRNQLDGDRSMNLGIIGLEDPAHATDADQSLNDIPAYGGRKWLHHDTTLQEAKRSYALQHPDRVLQAAMHQIERTAQ